MQQETVNLISFLFLVLMFVVCLYFLFAVPTDINTSWIEKKVCEANGFDELRYISNLGDVCMKYFPEGNLAFLVDCEYEPLVEVYWGATPQGCILIKEIVHPDYDRRFS